MTTDDLIAYYRGLLIQQYANKPRARATIEAVVGEVISGQVVQEVFDGFDVDTAVGAQLDILAQLRGIKRLVTGLDLGRVYFMMPSYDDADKATVPGMATYDDPATVNSFFAEYQDLNRPTYAMNDDELRRMIKLRAAFHSSHLGVGEIDLILMSFFGPNVLFADNADMTILYNKAVPDDDTLFSIAAATNSLPKPAGVAMTVSGN